MMDWTDRHCRYFFRLLSPGALLYTEMLTASAVIHGDRDRLLGFDQFERPLALQLGGCDPSEMAQAARIAADFGYDEVNINVGCPSDRVQSGRFGACLMLEPERVRECFIAMQDAVDIPVTVKSRIGVDDNDDHAFLEHFVAVLAGAGCATFVIHARKAILQGLSPKENREIPPLRYESVYRIKEDHPSLAVVINGGIRTSVDVQKHLAQVDGVMIGREAYRNPWFLTELEEVVLAGRPAGGRRQIIEAYLPYVEEQLARGIRLHSMTRHILGLYMGRPGARAWRRHLGRLGSSLDANASSIMEALELVESP